MSTENEIPPEGVKAMHENIESTVAEIYAAAFEKMIIDKVCLDCGHTILAGKLIGSLIFNRNMFVLTEQEEGEDPYMSVDVEAAKNILTAVFSIAKQSALAAEVEMRFANGEPDVQTDEFSPITVVH